MKQLGKRYFIEDPPSLGPLETLTTKQYLLKEMRMNQQPNFELLKEAYAIVGGIPARQFDLSDVVLERGESLACGTIACAAGWLGLHPKMQELGKFRTDRSCLKDSQTDQFVFYGTAMARLFNIDLDVADALFAPRGDGYLGEDKEVDFKGTDKQLWQARIRQFLREHGQLKHQLAKKGRAMDRYMKASAALQEL